MIGHLLRIGLVTVMTYTGDDLGDLMTVREAAERARFTRRTIERRIEDGTLETIRIPPRSIRITRESFERWIHAADPPQE